MTRVLLYDADCGFCTAAARWLQRRGCTVGITPWQGWPDLERHGITPEAAAAVLHAVDGETVVTGHRAIAVALGSTRPRTTRLLGRLIGSPMMDRAAAASYAWIAKHRHQLPGGTPACAPKESR